MNIIDLVLSRARAARETPPAANTAAADRPPVVVRIARDLAAILRLAPMLHGQAVALANARVDRSPLPGGAAMVLLGPAANLEDWTRRHDLAAAEWEKAGHPPKGYKHTDTPAVDEDDDDHMTALQLLRFWTDQWRITMRAAWDHIPTIQTEATFLRTHLQEIEQRHPDQLDRIAADVNQARTQLEVILSSSRRPEPSRVHCPNPIHPAPDHPQDNDHRPRLVKIPGARWLTAWSCRTCHTETPAHRACADCAHPYPPGPQRTCTRRRAKDAVCGGKITITTTAPAYCFNARCPDFHAPAEVYISDPELDRWKCLTCKTWYDHNGYNDALARDLRATAEADRWVPRTDAVDMLKAYGRSPETTRSWIKREPGISRPEKDPDTGEPTGRVLVRWSALWSRHLEAEAEAERCRRQDEQWAALVSKGVDPMEAGARLRIERRRLRRLAKRHATTTEGE